MKKDHMKEMKMYHAPELKKIGSVNDLTQGTTTNDPDFSREPAD